VVESELQELRVAARLPATDEATLEIGSSLIFPPVFGDLEMGKICSASEERISFPVVNSCILFNHKHAILSFHVSIALISPFLLLFSLSAVLWSFFHPSWFNFHFLLLQIICPLKTFTQSRIFNSTKDECACLSFANEIFLFRFFFFVFWELLQATCKGAGGTYQIVFSTQLSALWWSA